MRTSGLGSDDFGALGHSKKQRLPRVACPVYIAFDHVLVVLPLKLHRERSIGRPKHDAWLSMVGDRDGHIDLIIRLFVDADTVVVSATA